MNKTLVTVLGGIVAASLSGCIAVPVRGGGYAEGGYAPPPGGVYVAPTYVSPGPGWAWQYHAQYGWGWHHPQHGWHQGWR